MRLGAVLQKPAAVCIFLETTNRLPMPKHGSYKLLPLEFMPAYPPIIGISREDAQISTSYPLATAVRLNDTRDHAYMATVGFFHQFHCLVSPQASEVYRTGR